MSSRKRPRSLAWRAAVPAVFGLAGALFATSASSADGIDLRSSTTDIATLVQERARSVAALREREQQLQQDVAALTASVQDGAVATARRQASRLAPAAGLTAVQGPGLRIELDDAPRDREIPDGVDPNWLIVHQQDIQAFVNAMWAGGATAISLQGQRLISTSGIKCVGNTVVIKGVPYSPPYVIEAVGDPAALRISLEGSQAVQSYRSYVEQYSLGLTVETLAAIEIPAYEGALRLEHARAKPGAD
jgi:uncharacterized protein YlxW (UPF0749 family)